MKNKKRKGFSLLEILLVLGIVAALIVTAFIVYKKVERSKRINNAINEILILKNATISAYASQGSYLGLSQNVIMNDIPNNMISSDKNIVNIFGQTVGISGSWMTAAGTGNSGFYIRYTMDPDSCFQVVKNLTSSFNYIQVNTTQVVDNITNVKVDDSSVLTLCNQYSNRAELQLYSN